MARPKEFSEIDALDAAVDCFWKHGFTASSVRELGQQMGVSSPSLYNAFGDKQALFAQALERYLDQTVRERIGRLERSLPPDKAVRAFITEVVKRALGDTDRRGCLLINSALEAGRDTPDLSRSIAGYLGEIEAFFRRSFRKAQAEGKVVSSHKPEDLARMLLGILLGLRVISRVNPDRTLVEGMAFTALALLEGPSRQMRN